MSTVIIINQQKILLRMNQKLIFLKIISAPQIESIKMKMSLLLDKKFRKKILEKNKLMKKIIKSHISIIGSKIKIKLFMFLVIVIQNNFTLNKIDQFFVFIFFIFYKIFKNIFLNLSFNYIIKKESIF